MKSIYFSVLIFMFTACKSSQTTTVINNTGSNTKKETVVDVKKNGLFVSNEKFDKIESTYEKYLISIDKTANRENRYDLSIKEKTSGTIKPVFLSFLTTEQTEKEFLVKIFLAQKENSYSWKPVASSFVETSFDLLDGHITYRQEGNIMSKYNPKHQKQDKHHTDRLTNKQAIEVAVKYYTEHYEKTFVR